MNLFFSPQCLRSTIFTKARGRTIQKELHNRLGTTTCCQNLNATNPSFSVHQDMIWKKGKWGVMLFSSGSNNNGLVCLVLMSSSTSQSVYLYNAPSCYTTSSSLKSCLNGLPWPSLFLKIICTLELKITGIQMVW